jgi:hypothetical protein
LGKGLKSSDIYIVIIYYQNVLLARLKQELAMIIRLQMGTVFSSELHQHPPKSTAVTLRLEAVSFSENGTNTHHRPLHIPRKKMKTGIWY